MKERKWLRKCMRPVYGGSVPWPSSWIEFRGFRRQIVRWPCMRDFSWHGEDG